MLVWPSSLYVRGDTPDDHLFEFTGGRILHNVFPACAGEFEAELIALAPLRTMQRPLSS